MEFAYFINLQSQADHTNSIRTACSVNLHVRGCFTADDWTSNLCLCSMLMMNRASLARTAADCWVPFLVEQNYKTQFSDNEAKNPKNLHLLSCSERKHKQHAVWIHFTTHHKCRLLLSVRLYDVGYLVVKCQIKLELSLIWTTGESQHHLP